MGDPTLAQELEAAPAVVRPEGNCEHLAHFAIEVREITLGVIDDADGDVGRARQALGEQAQDDAFAAAGFAVDHGEAALADLGVFDAPAETLDLRRYVDRSGG